MGLHLKTQENSSLFPPAEDETKEMEGKKAQTGLSGTQSVDAEWAWNTKNVFARRRA